MTGAEDCRISNVQKWGNSILRCRAICFKLRDIGYVIVIVAIIRCFCVRWTQIRVKCHEV